MKLKKNIVIAPCGSLSPAHKEWIEGEKNFDLFLINYSDEQDIYRDDADYYLNIEGLKLSILKHAIESHREVVESYEAVWLPDDDLSISTEAINKLFDIFHENKLAVAQPAVKNNFYNYRSTSKRFFSKLRYVNFIEMMCPLFRTDVLFEILPLFNSNKSGFGIDWLWSRRLGGRPVAIIDESGVVHTKPCLHKGPYYDKLKSMGVDERRESAELLKSHGIQNEHVTYDFVYTKAGKVLSRLYLVSISEYVFRTLAKLFYWAKGL